MKNKVLIHVLYMTKKFIYILLIQCVSMSLLLAANSNAQVKSIDEVVIRIGMSDMPIEKVFSEVERRTGFNFVYTNKELESFQTITVERKRQTLYDLLVEIAAQTHLEFKQVNHNIHVKKAIKGEEVPVTIAELVEDVTITGTVVDQHGDPIPGATVSVPGTGIGTATDFDGNYSLTVPEGSTLVFSFIGFETQTIAIGGRSVIDVTLVEDMASLEEVVVVGYGTVKKSDLTGSVASINTEVFQNQPMTQFTDMLTGTVAGFSATQSTSAAGGSSMEIRGPNSLSAGTSPLIVLDGVVYNGSISDINPNDIESIDILKDASSAAVFGARAASGVVLVTTRRGKTGEPVINFTTKIGMTEAASHYRPLGPEEYLQFKGDYFRTASNFTQPRYYYTRPDRLGNNLNIEEWRNYSQNPNPDNTIEYLNRLNLYEDEVAQYLAGSPTDWYGMVMVKGYTQNYDLSVGGGTEKIRYHWSLGYVDNEGIIKGDQFSAVRSRLNVDFTINDWLTLGAYTQFSDRNESATPANLNRTYRISPWSSPTYNGPLTPQADYDFRLVRTTEHPLMEYLYSDRYRKVNNLFSSIFAEVKLPLGFRFKSSFQPRYSFLKDYRFYGDHHTMGYADHIDGYGTRLETSSFEWMIDNLLYWNKEFGDHNFDLTLLHNAEHLRTWNTNINNQTFSPNQNLGYHGMQFGNAPMMTTTDTEATGDALMARLNYSLSNKYLLTASIRRDGYSAFGQENPRAVFPAFAFAWRISEEGFFNSELINWMKPRISWGVNGNRDIGAYSALANLGSNLWYDGSGVQVGVFNNTLANTGLTWERTESYNIGVDMGMFDDKLDLTLDYYDMTTTNLLMNRTLPDIIGFRNIMSNLGELGNRGFEATINSTNINNSKLSWRSSLVFSLNRNKVKKLFGDVGNYTLLGEERSGELPDFTNQWFPGQAIDVIWDYEVLGIWQEEEVDEAAEYGLRIGDYKAVDVDGDGRYIDLNDKQFIGYEEPRYRIGLRNDFTFLRDFNVSFFIRADLGHYGRFTPVFQGSSEFDRFSMGAKPYPYWMPENRNNEFPRLDANVTTGAYGGGIRIYKPLSFVRLQDLSVSYALPFAVAEKFRLDSFRAFISARNLYSFDKWPGWDPESRMAAMPRTFSLGFSLSL